MDYYGDGINGFGKRQPVRIRLSEGRKDIDNFPLLPYRAIALSGRAPHNSGLLPEERSLDDR
jgi:hypothetical protein